MRVQFMSGAAVVLATAPAATHRLAPVAAAMITALAAAAAVAQPMAACLPPRCVLYRLRYLRPGTLESPIVHGPLRLISLRPRRSQAWDVTDS
jgi:hypothetical protein